VAPKPVGFGATVLSSSVGVDLVRRPAGRHPVPPRPARGDHSYRWTDDGRTRRRAPSAGYSRALARQTCRSARRSSTGGTVPDPVVVAHARWCVGSPVSDRAAGSVVGGGPPVPRGMPRDGRYGCGVPVGTRVATSGDGPGAPPRRRSAKPRSGRRSRSGSGRGRAPAASPARTTAVTLNGRPAGTSRATSRPATSHTPGANPPVQPGPEERRPDPVRHTVPPVRRPTRATPTGTPPGCAARPPSARV